MKKLGINGFGRIGKLTVWHHVARKFFDEIVVNVGRNVGTSLEDIAHYVERDSTHGLLRGYLYGNNSEPVMSDVDAKHVDGVTVQFLRQSRNLKEIAWQENSVSKWNMILSLTV